MNFDDEQLKAQDALISELEKELQRLNGDFDNLLKEARISMDELKSIAGSGDFPPELRAAYEEAVQKAEREGKARASQFETAHGNATVPGAGRKDVIRL